MRRQSIHISIPTPCHENWWNMDATERGAFCHSCQKEVIDFSAMTDREVIEYLEKHKTSCGRFREDQVDTKLTIPRLDNGVFKWRALFLSALAFLSAKNMMAQSDKKPCANQIAIPKTEQKRKSMSDTIELPTVLVTAIGVRLIDQGYITGITQEILSVKPSTETKRTIDDNEPPVHKQKGLDWFRRLFRIKRKN